MFPDEWTARDRDILATLALKVCLLSFRQLCTTWWNPGRHHCKGAEQRMTLLEEAKLVDRFYFNLPPSLEPSAPICRWSPGAPAPDFDLVSWSLQRRFEEPPQPMRVYVISKLGANLFGSYGGKPPRVDQAIHDAHLADVYLYYRRSRPDEAQRWWGEHAFGKAGYRIKDPDAFICDSGGKPVRVVECGGTYNPRQVRSFHAHCEAENLPYELW